MAKQTSLVPGAKINQELITNDKRISKKNLDLSKFNSLGKDTFAKVFFQFIETGLTSTNRATFYNPKNQQDDATTLVHKNLYSIDRGVYAMSLLLEGHTDYTITQGIINLLSNKGDIDSSIIDVIVETKIIAYLLQNIPVQRMLKMFLKLKEFKVNNARTKRVIIKSILNASNLAYWSINYRTKLRLSLKHAYGHAVLSKIEISFKKAINKWTDEDHSIITNHVDVFLNPGIDKIKVYECLSFIIGNTPDTNIPEIKSFYDSKIDIRKGHLLPESTLIGIKGIYHKGIDKAVILEVTKKNFTEKQKMQVQNRAKEANVTVEFNAAKQDVVELYIHAYAQGVISEDVKKALQVKAIRSAKNSPLSYSKIGIVFDASKSSQGSITQKYRPIAVSQAIRDMLIATANGNAEIYYVGGELKNDIVYPTGESNIAKGLIEMLKSEPDAIFIISDGYENAPAGRTAEIIEAVNKLGLNISIYQISPVMSAEVAGIKALSDKISLIPAKGPESLGTGLLKSIMQQNSVDGMYAVINTVLPKIISMSSKDIISIDKH